MELLIVISALFLGMILLGVEIYFVPGTTVIGVIGGLLAVFGIIMAYKYFGVSIGNITAISSFCIFSIALIYVFKSGNLEKYALKKTSEAHFDSQETFYLLIGDEGKTSSVLRPVGTAVFDDKVFNVTANHGMISENQAVKIVKIEKQKITVSPV